MIERTLFDKGQISNIIEDTVFSLPDPDWKEFVTAKKVIWLDQIKLPAGIKSGADFPAAAHTILFCLRVMAARTVWS